MRQFRDVCFITLCAGLLVFYGVRERPLTRSSEGRVARVAQEMLDDGDWIVPHLNGVVRLEKPPFSSWLVALVPKVFSSSPDEKSEVRAWHAYVPPGIATILLLLLIYSWMIQSSGLSEKDLRGEAPRLLGLLAALVLASAPGFFNQARSAEMDMLLALWVALALWGSWQFRVSGCRYAMLIAYAAVGLSIHTKGHVGLVIVVPTLLIWNLVERSHAALTMPPQNRWRWHVVGVALIALIVLPWGIPFLKQSGLTWDSFWKEGLGGRFGSEAPHQEAFYWYFMQIPGWFLPWTVLLPLALWQTRELAPDECSPLRRLCWIWLGWSTLLFSLISSKQRHYAIPFFAPLAILIADSVVRWIQHPDAQIARTARTTLAIFSAAFAIAALAAVPAAGKYFVSAAATQIWISAVLAAALFGFAAIRFFSCLSAVYLWWAGCVCLMTIFAQTIERRDALDSPEPFCSTVRDKVPGGAELFDFDVALPRREGAKGKPVWRAQVLFYLRRKVTETEISLGDLLKQKKDAFIIATQKNLDGVSKDDYAVLAHEEKFLGHKNDVFLIQSKAP